MRNIYFYFTFCTIFVKLVTLKLTRAYKSPRQSKFKKTHRFMERFHVTSSAILVSSKTMKWRLCWCSSSPAGVLKPFSYVKTFPCPKGLRSCWSLDWKGPFLSLYSRWRHLLILMCQLEAHLFSKQIFFCFACYTFASQKDCGFTIHWDNESESAKWRNSNRRCLSLNRINWLATQRLSSLNKYQTIIQ